MSCINEHRCESCPAPCKTRVRNKEHNKWFSSLTIAEKRAVTGEDYPKCTEVWLKMKRDEREQAIQRSGLYRRRGNKDTALGHDF